MKRSFVGAIIAILLVAVATEATSQSLLRNIGARIGRAVANEVVNEVKRKKSSKKREQQTQQQPQQQARQQPQQQPRQQAQQQPQQQPQQPQQQARQQVQQQTQQRPQQPKQQAVVVVDKGQNIVRQSGLDYIDEYGINHGGGILIDSVLWAPVNCGYHATNYPYGKLYQWGRKHGQGYAAPFVSEKANVKPDAKGAEIVPAPVTPATAIKYPNRFYARSDMSLFNWTTNNLDLWNRTTDDCKIYKNTAYDPCPKGWRLPDLFDFYCLAKNYSKLTEYNGQPGRWLSGNTPYSTEVQRIFLPLAGARERNGSARARHLYGLYWSGRHGGGEGLVWHMQVSDNGVDVNPHAYPHEAYSVRCVKDVPGQRAR